jgi:hypothetical protein
MFETATFVIVKRLLYSFAVLVYSILAVGVQIHLHYCCGKLHDMSFYSQAKSCCEHGNNEACSLDHSCCDFKEIAFEVKDQYHHQSKYSFEADLIPISIVERNVDIVKSALTVEPCLPELDPAPDWPCYIRFQSLLFYA